MIKSSTAIQADFTMQQQIFSKHFKPSMDAFRFFSAGLERVFRYQKLAYDDFSNIAKFLLNFFVKN